MAGTVEFETLPGLAPGAFAIKDFKVEIVDSGQNPTNVIRTTDQAQVNVSWTTSGVLSTYLPGNWHVYCFLESLGTGDDYDLTAKVNPIKLTPGPGDINYKAQIEVPPNKVQIPQGHPRESMPMKMVVTVTYDWSNNVPGPMAGYCEMPVILFFDPK